MPEYLAPGVFVEETSFRHKSIEGVGTSVAALVGPTRYGPLRGAPEVVTSLTEYTRIYGDGADLVFDGVGEPNYTAIAARAFFDNGGKQLFVSRVCRDVNRADAVNDGSGAVRAVAAAPGARLRFEARFPGAAGNFTLEVRWRDAGNLLEQAAIQQMGEHSIKTIRRFPHVLEKQNAVLEDGLPRCADEGAKQG